MLLQRLAEYAERPWPAAEALPTLYAKTPVRYVIDLDETGRFLALNDTADRADPKTRRGVARAVPQVQRSSAIKPLLLADKADYSFGYTAEPAKVARTAACHAAYLDLLRRCVAATDSPGLSAVLTFLENDPLARLGLPADFDPGALITFRVGGAFPVDEPGVCEFWAETNDAALAGAPVMQCVVCGRRRPVLRRLQGKVKGIPGGQTSGTAIISANAEAFESFGQPASLVAPTCGSCGQAFTRGANALLADPASRIVLGGGIFVFWTREPIAFSIRDALVQPSSEAVVDHVRALLSGARQPGIDATAFYGTWLTASGGRAVVRDWIDTTVGEVKEGLKKWFERQRIVGPWGDSPRLYGLFALAAATVREVRTDLSPTTSRALLHAALTETPVPPDLLYQAVRRARAEQGIDAPRAALIKLVLTSGPLAGQEEEMVQLVNDNPSPAYQCGRLLAVIEEIQRAALPGVNTTVVDRFYGTASSAPMSVFPRLLRGARPHLARLERDQHGTWSVLERRLEEVQTRLTAFPRVLTLEDQGLFALGYYHQRANDRAERRAAAERRDAATQRRTQTHQPPTDEGITQEAD